MDQSLLMSDIHCEGNLLDQPHGGPRAHQLVGLGEGRQIASLNVLHRHHQLAVDHADIVDLADVGMRQLGRELGLAYEPRPHLLLFARLELRDLESHLTLQHRVLGQIYRPHTAASEFPENLVPPQRLELRGRADLRLRLGADLRIAGEECVTPRGWGDGE